MKSQVGIMLMAFGLAAGPASADERIRITLRDGLVSLTASQVSVREILAEWARVGEVHVVNADKLSGPPVTLTLTDVPERKALDTLLRKAAGFLVAPRGPEAVTASRSVYDRLIIMPTSAGATMPLPAVAGGPGRVPVPGQYPEPVMIDPSGAAMPGATPEPAPDVIYADQPPETQFDYANPQSLDQYRQQMMQTGVPPGPMFFPSSVNVDPQQAAPDVTEPVFTPSAGQTTTRPGEIVQPPATPQQFRNPYGIPGDVAPGSVEPPINLEPDRSKYLNPYQPTPPPVRPPLD
jgi:hypothetical protein